MPEKFGDKSQRITEQYPDTMPRLRVVFDHCKEGEPVAHRSLGRTGGTSEGSRPRDVRRGEPVEDS